MHSHTRAYAHSNVGTRLQALGQPLSAVRCDVVLPEGETLKLEVGLQHVAKGTGASVSQGVRSQL